MRKGKTFIISGPSGVGKSTVLKKRSVSGAWNSLTIHAPAGSYAETYAKENNIPFVAE